MMRLFPYPYILSLVLHYQYAWAALNTCSTQNTADESTLDVSIYQSNGLCEDHCSGYAYAIVNGKSCYCSNYSPDSTSSSSSCEIQCPGYPSDYCAGNSYYGYILLSTPSGTMSASGSGSGSASSSSSDDTSSSASSVSSSSASSQTQSSQSSSRGSSISSSAGSSSGSTSSSSSSANSVSSSTSTSTSTSIKPSVVTITGHVETVTIDPTSSPTVATSQSQNSANTAKASPSSTGSSKSSGFFSNKGKVAGTFTVVGLVALALILFIIFFFCRRRRQQQEDNDGAPGAGSYKEGKTFNIIGSSPPIDSPAGGGADGIKRDQSTATTLAGYGYDEKNGGFSKGGSIVPIVDQRLDPSQIFFNWNENNSRRSLQDEQDYTRRVLRVANPGD